MSAAANGNRWTRTYANFGASLSYGREGGGESTIDPTCSTLGAMANLRNPVLRAIEEVSLIGTTAIYHSQAEASQGIPEQWRAFRRAHPALESTATFYGASPCTDDRKIHYLTGVAHQGPAGMVDDERLILEAAEYAVMHVSETESLRDAWIWLLGHWLASSGRREKNAPEFERFANISEAGTPIGPVEICIPLEPLSRD